jgi:putative tricarboxylic transport membrane protein
MNGNEPAGGAGPSQRSVEFGVASFIALLGIITIIGSLRVGIGWGAEGPKSGFFPFYIGLLIILASAVNLIQILRTHSPKLLAEWGQLRQVLSVLVPTTIYVLIIPTIGIYLASAILIAVFMRWLGGYSWPLTLGVAVGTPVALFLIFESWFLVPLPKGPIEEWFGL